MSDINTAISAIDNAIIDTQKKADETACKDLRDQWLKDVKDLQIAREIIKPSDPKLITQQELHDFFEEDDAQQISRYLATNMNLMLKGMRTPQQFIDMHRPEGEEDAT